MKKFLILIVLLGFSLEAKDKVKPGFLVYKGNFFDIQYPKNFRPSPSLKGLKADDPKPDSARFLSPDKSVEFFIYSPQWSGSDPYTDIDSQKETLKEEKTETAKDGTVHKWYTYSAKNGSYTRAFHESFHPEYNTKRIFGVKFKDQNSYKKHQKDYLHFKKSLIQYGD
jgi:hypothetical protein